MHSPKETPKDSIQRFSRVAGGGGEIGGDPGRRIVFHRIPGYIDFSYFDPQDRAGQNTQNERYSGNVLYEDAADERICRSFFTFTNGRLNVGKFLCEKNGEPFF